MIKMIMANLLLNIKIKYKKIKITKKEIIFLIIIKK
jgi:hypothetical protein